MELWLWLKKTSVTYKRPGPTGWTYLPSPNTEWPYLLNGHFEVKWHFYQSVFTPDCSDKAEWRLAFSYRVQKHVDEAGRRDGVDQLFHLNKNKTWRFEAVFVGLDDKYLHGFRGLAIEVQSIKVNVPITFFFFFFTSFRLQQLETGIFILLLFFCLNYEVSVTWLQIISHQNNSSFFFFSPLLLFTCFIVFIFFCCDHILTVAFWSSIFYNNKNGWFFNIWIHLGFLCR